ncbi:hypothetical protein [Elongatibacter sediminis]|uniref:Lipoprotein n=1 Tax=Elongatibacter sediminis TaxID=3119006 RepID=A0AAW9RLK2_9GAMM
MTPKAGLCLTLTLTLALSAGCSTVSSILPHGPEPVCGSAIHRGSVRVLDMTAYELNETRISAAIEERVGAYRILTDEPVWIPKRSTHGESAYAGNIATVQSIAGEWGCNLLILLDTRMERTSVRTQSRNESRVFLVHAGRLGDSG